MNNKNRKKEQWFITLLYGLSIFLFLCFAFVLFRRSFNFDEFQALYSGVSLLRGKALYADQIDRHFPFFNIVLSIFVQLTGFKAITILYARFLILIVNGLTLLYIYKIGRLLWNKSTGLLAVSLTLVSLVYVDKGIEIRWDVFSMMFLVMGGYYGLRYVRELGFGHLIMSALFLGAAGATTQKAFFGLFSIALGIFLYFFYKRSYGEIVRSIICFLFIIPIPLICCLAYLVLFHNDTLYHFIHEALLDIWDSFGPMKENLFPFPYTKSEQLGRLIFQNHLFYIAGMAGIIFAIIHWIKNGSDKILFGCWALMGILFFVTAKRPFYQTLLPTIPPLSLLAARILILALQKIRVMRPIKQFGLTAIIFFLFYIWPIHLVWNDLYRDPGFLIQVENISFCLANLRADDKVLCFSKNQVYFDPIFKIDDRECGDRFYEYDADCFKRSMMDNNCKLIIDDYRTKLLNHRIRQRIKNNYIFADTGSILIPGFMIPQKKLYLKGVWIEGDYYSPTKVLKIDGKDIESNVIHLKNKEYLFHNLSHKPIRLVYIFHPERFLEILNPAQ